MTIVWMSDSGWSDYDDDDLESISGVPHARKIPTTPTVSSPTSSKSPRIDSVFPDSPDITNFASLLLDHSRWRKDRMVLHVGFLSRRSRLSGRHELKFVEVRGGLLRYMDVPGKNFALSPKNTSNDSERIERILSGSATELSLLGASVSVLSQNSLIVAFPFKYQTRPIRSRIFRLFSSGPLSSEMSQWTDSIRDAAHWRFWAQQLRIPHPLKHRVCGIITIHILHVQLESSGSSEIDPYVVARFADVRSRTRTILNVASATQEPVDFDEFIQIPVSYDNPNWSVMIRVMDESFIAGEGLLGVCAVPLHALGVNEEKVWNFPLVTESGTSRVGHVLCRTYYQSSQITRFLPLYPSHVHEPESLVAPHQVTLITAKAHYTRMAAIVNHFLTIRNVFDDYIFFEKFAVSFFGYCVLTFAFLVVPQHSLMILLLLVGLGVLSSHPEAGTFWGQIFSSRSQKNDPKRQLRRSDGIMSSWIGSSGFFPSEISVYECERRRWSVSANSLTQFGHENLRQSEPRWVGIFGDPIGPESLQSVTVDDKRIVWNSVCNEHTDKNGWEYGKKFPEKNWVEMTREEENAEWSKSYDPVRHRVRRRLWVGEVGGYMEPGELPLSLPETVDAENHFVTNKSHRMFEESAADSPRSKGLLGKYYRLMEMLYRVQSGAGSASLRIEQFSNILNWKSRWLTGFFFWVLIACIFASAILSPNILVWLIITVVHYNGYKKWRSRMKRVRFFLKHFKDVVKESNETFRGVHGDLLKLAKFPWRPFSHTEVSKDIINLAVQKTVDKLQLGIAVTLNHTKECACMYELVQVVYMKKFGRKWASREVKSISMASLMDQHLIGDWELYQPHSVFRHN